jgi:hypothetical protein
MRACTTCGSCRCGRSRRPLKGSSRNTGGSLRRRPNCEFFFEVFCSKLFFLLGGVLDLSMGIQGRSVEEVIRDRALIRFTFIYT